MLRKRPISEVTLQEEPALSTQPTVLQYAACRVPSNRRAFLVTPILGILAGGLLGLMPYGAFCGLFGVGFWIGAACSHLASTHRVLFGVVGNVLAVTALLLAAAVSRWSHGFSMMAYGGVREFFAITAFVLGIFVVPGLLGSWIVVRAKRPAA